MITQTDKNKNKTLL